MTRAGRAALAMLAVAACGRGDRPRDQEQADEAAAALPPPRHREGARQPMVWPELADLPLAEAELRIAAPLIPLVTATRSSPRRATLTYRGELLAWELVDGELIGFHGAKEHWRFGRRVAALVGGIAAEPPEFPVVRVFGAPIDDADQHLILLDIEGTEGSNGSAAQSVPGTLVLATALGPAGVTAAAVRLEPTRDYVAVFDGHGMLRVVSPLPATPRTSVQLVVRAASVTVIDDRSVATIATVWEAATPPPPSPTVPGSSTPSSP